MAHPSPPATYGAPGSKPLAYLLLTKRRNIPEAVNAPSLPAMQKKSLQQQNSPISPTVVGASRPTPHALRPLPSPGSRRIDGNLPTSKNAIISHYHSKNLSESPPRTLGMTSSMRTASREGTGRCYPRSDSHSPSETQHRDTRRAARRNRLDAFFRKKDIFQTYGRV